MLLINYIHKLLIYNINLIFYLNGFTTIFLIFLILYIILGTEILKQLKRSKLFLIVNLAQLIHLIAYLLVFINNTDSCPYKLYIINFISFRVDYFIMGIFKTLFASIQWVSLLLDKVPRSIEPIGTKIAFNRIIL